jgi:hypothetical protein
MRLPLGLELDKDCKVGLRLLRAGPGQQSIIAYARTRSEQRTALRTFSSPAGSLWSGLNDAEAGVVVLTFDYYCHFRTMDLAR